MRACGRARAGACSVTRACADESRCVLCRTPVGTRRGRSITGFHKHVAAGLLGQARSAQYRCYLGRARSSGALQSGLERRRLAPARRSEPAQIITRSTAARRASACGDGGVEGLGEAVLDAKHLRLWIAAHGLQALSHACRRAPRRDMRQGVISSTRLSASPRQDRSWRAVGFLPRATAGLHAQTKGRGGGGGGGGLPWRSSKTMACRHTSTSRDTSCSLRILHIYK